MATLASLVVKIAGDTASLTAALGRAEKQSTSFAGNVQSKMKMLGTAIAAAGSAYGAFEALKGAVNATQELGMAVNKLSRETGLTTEAASELLFAFKHVGLSSDDASRSIGIFAKKLKGVSDEETGVVTGGKSTAAILGDIGIKATDAEGNLRPISGLLSELADHFKTMPNGLEKTGLAMQLFGRSGKDMIPLLNQGSAGLTELAAEAKKLGVVLTTENVAAIKKYTYAQRDMNEALTGLKVELGMEVIPKLTELMKLLTDLQPIVRNATKVINDEFLVSIAKNMGPAFTAVAGIIKPILDLQHALKGDSEAAQDAADAMAEVEEPTKSATDAFKDQLSAVTGLSDALKGLDSILEGLGQQETAEEAGLKASSSALEEQIKWREAWVKSGGALTEEQQWELEVWKNQKEGIDAQAEAIKASKDSYVANIEALQSGRPTLEGVKRDINGAETSYLNLGTALQQTTDIVNSCSLAPIQTDLEGLASVADLAGDAAGRMARAWQQALRDSTATFQEIGRHIDEEAAHLQSLAPYVPLTPTPTRVHPIPYAEGGIVPGPLGRPQLGLLHGGEEVLRAADRSARGGQVINNMEMHVTINGSSEEALQRLEALFNTLLRRAGMGGSSVSAGAFIPA